MRVHVYRGGDRTDACTRYRQVLPTEVLQGQGADVHLLDNVEGVVWQRQADGTGKVADWTPDCDVAVFQRPASREIADLIEIAAGKCAVVVDMDDDFFAVPKENFAWGAFQGPDRNIGHLKRALDAAHLITVTTPALARRYGRAKSVVLPNYVPEAYLSVAPDAHPPRIGWTGTMRTHPFDLESTRGAVGQALMLTNYGFHVVGEGEGVQEALGLSSFSAFTSTGWVQFEDYAWEMAALDLGIVPLKSSAFNHGKSWLKGLEFASLGVPFIASNTQPYVELESLGIGIVARNPKEWEWSIRKLLANPDFLRDVGQQGREIVRKSFTIEQHAERWWSAWSDSVAQKPRHALV